MTKSIRQPRIFVTTSDKYISALYPFSYLLNKYWIPNPKVVVMGFASPQKKLPDNFSFYSVGNQSDYPFSKWSNALIKFLDVFDDEAFVLMLEDYWITRPVDTIAVKILYDYILQFKYVVKIDLCADRLYAHGADLDYGTVAYLDLVKSMPGSPYHLSLMAGIWRREHFLKHLIPNESPHDVELIGTTRLSHDQNVIVLGTRQWPVKHILGLRGGDHNTINLKGLKDVDIEEMKNRGYFKVWSK